MATTLDQVAGRLTQGQTSVTATRLILAPIISAPTILETSHMVVTLHQIKTTMHLMRQALMGMLILLLAILRLIKVISLVTTGPTPIPYLGLIAIGMAQRHMHHCKSIIFQRTTTTK